LTCGHQCPSVCGEVCPDVSCCQDCSQPAIKDMEVDFIMGATFGEVDLDENPCIIPPCGHILTLESMDGHMSMSDFYISDVDGSIVGLKNSNEPFSASDLKTCPTCRGPLRSINRYSRIVRRALIDESTKKFIVWANMGFIPLVTKMQLIEAELRESAGTISDASGGVSLEAPHSGKLDLNGTPGQQIAQTETFMHKEKIFRTIIDLRRRTKRFLSQVNEKEQPFGRIHDLAQDAHRHRGVDVDADLHSRVDVLEVRNRLLTTALLIRCDYTILLTFLEKCKGKMKARFSSIRVDFSINRKECELLVVEAHTKHQPGIEVEGHLYWARFFVLERSFAEPGEKITQLLNEAKEHVQLARGICDACPGQTKGMRNEVEDVEKMLRGSTFYLPVSNEEKAAVYAAMAQNFRGTGHWYYCANGHPFTIGECGMPMETSTCPQCGATVGGQSHTAVEGVTRATDLDEQFGRMRV
jgi:hypothetical protein